MAEQDFLASCILNPSKVYLQFSPIFPVLKGFIYTTPGGNPGSNNGNGESITNIYHTGDQWNDSLRNACTQQLISYSVIKVEPDDITNTYPLFNYTPSISAKKYFLGGDRKEPLYLARIVGYHQAYISAFKNQVYITFKSKLNNTNWEIINNLTIMRDGIKEEQSKLDWRKSITQNSNFFAPSSGNLCIDNYRTTPNVNIINNTLYRWNIDNQINNQDLLTEVTVRPLKDNGYACQPGITKTKKIKAYSIQNSQAIIEGAAPMRYERIINT